MNKNKLIFSFFGNSIIMAIIIIIIVVSCSNNQSNNDNVIIKKQYYDDGMLFSEQEYINDSIAGFYKEYYEDGQLKFITNCKNNLFEGEAIWFHNTGGIECKAYYEDGKRKGGRYWYDEDGKIKLYMYNDHLGRPMYRLDYKNNGTIIEKGSAFPMIFFDSTVLSIGNTFTALIYTINPPKFENRKLFIKERLNDEVTFFSEVPITDEWYLLEKRIDKKGEYSWQLILEFDTPWGKKKYDEYECSENKSEYKINLIVE